MAQARHNLYPQLKAHRAGNAGNQQSDKINCSSTTPSQTGSLNKHENSSRQMGQTGGNTQASSALSNKLPQPPSIKS
ncbi:Hypothetical protein P9303_22241 [Prochlorococcus marinus str. MIT 9303]|uniref:Uncharacterized protein n=1 Tax=Prochlorococcus marinus (strain MIT 9303) TaxID=59922 RepID=A2CBU9_PROM3|nr:Hypothetical protein P9303_22241 [Prochlorococcus marinus str. MIT 9303]